MSDSNAPHRFGWFRELDHGEPEGASLRDAVRESPDDDCERISKYLLNGWVAADVMDVNTHDVLDAARPVIGPYFILTDGVWAWPSDLAYFYLKYNVELPDEFVDHMRSNGWVPPDITPEQASTVGRQVLNAVPMDEPAAE